MSKKNIKKKIENALDKLKEKDKFSIKEDVNEQSITSKLASYLREYFLKLNVDSEYNRMMTKEGEQATKKVFGEVVYPDIVVHNQENNTENLLVIEAKKKKSDKKKEDYKKLNHFMEPKNKGGLDYDYSAFIIFDTDNPNKSYLEDVKEPGEYWK